MDRLLDFSFVKFKLEKTAKKIKIFITWWDGGDSNPGQHGLQPCALPG